MRQTLEKGGMKVVGDAKSQKKYEGGACSKEQTILGLVYDCSDPMRPCTGLPIAKQEELKERLETMSINNRRRIEKREVESIAHKLSAAALAVERGRIYLCGFFAALREEEDEEGEIRYSRWLRRNVNWWLEYFKAGAPRMRLLVSRPNQPQKYCPHTDASTEWGFGGYFIRKECEVLKCYYIQGEWSRIEKELIEEQEGVGIAFLEMAAVDFLIAAAEEVGGFEGKNFDFYCDNQNALCILTSYRSRTLPLSLLLERIDRRIETNEYTVAFMYINTKLNVGSDALSRDALREFKEYVSSVYAVECFIELQVPEEARNIERVVDDFREHPEWIVLDGEKPTED